MKTSNCPVCRKGSLERKSKRVAFKYKGRVLKYDQPGDYCDSCGEVVLDKSDIGAVESHIFDFQAEVDGRLKTSDIRRIRKKLGLTQQEAGEIIGGGHNAFSRYERGQAYPTKGTENFLIVLDKHPAVLEELRRKKKKAA